MIREAVEADRFTILRLGRAFLAASGMPFGFEAAWAERSAKAYIADADKLCLVMEVEDRVRGVLFAHACDHPFGPFRIAMELLWWVDPAYRGKTSLKMLGAYEAWACDQGCAYVGMASLAAEPRAARIYERRGYRPVETHFLKEL